jgi:hypothetical protein
MLDTVFKFKNDIKDDIKFSNENIRDSSITTIFGLLPCKLMNVSLHITDKGVTESIINTISVPLTRIPSNIKLIIATIENVKIHVNEDDNIFFAPALPLAEVFDPTGAGDTFGAGGTAARLLGLSDAAMIVCGACASGFYVRSGRFPTLDQILELAERWNDGSLPERLTD